jgi:hypothetical protein
LDTTELPSVPREGRSAGVASRDARGVDRVARVVDRLVVL